MKRLTVMILALAMVISMAGCKTSDNGKTETTTKSTISKAENETENEDETSKNEDETESESKDETASPSADVMELDKAQDILNNFKEFSFTITSSDSKNGSTYSFTNVGKESINGTDAEHIKFTTTDPKGEKKYEGWYTSEWKAVKYIDNTGKERTGDEAEMGGSTLTVIMQIYINTAKTYKTIFKEDGTIDDEMYKEQESSSENLDLGSGSTEIKVKKYKDFVGNLKNIGTAEINGKAVYTILETALKGTTDFYGVRVKRAVAK